MKKILKIIFKGIAILLGVVLLAGVILYLVYDKPLPEGTSGSKADALAKDMLKAVNEDSYKNTRYLEWQMRNGANTYKWDKDTQIARVEWSGNRVLLNLRDSGKSSVLESDPLVSKSDSTELVKKALSQFNNDSFWLVAPFKVFDPGTVRKTSTLADGSVGLLVTYKQGGTTPGDSYLWNLGDNGFPESFRMWVDIIPIGGLEATWEEWQVMESGVFLPTAHQLGPLHFEMENVRAYN